MTVEPLPAQLRDRYLRHIGVDGQLGRPSAEALRVLHRAQLDTVPYENVEIQLGRPTTIDPAESASRIVTGRGGYCYHLNGSFAALLASVGFRVDLVRGAVPDGTDPAQWGTHMVLLVHIDEATWLADVGLGDGFREPVPLEAGDYPQWPFRYGLRWRSGPVWRFEHDPRASITGFDVNVTPCGLDAFTAQHDRLSTSPGSPFVQKFVVQTRRAEHARTLRGCVLINADEHGRTSRDVTTEAEWFGLLDDMFGVRLDHHDRSAVWRRARSAHEAWEAAGRP